MKEKIKKNYWSMFYPTSIEIFKMIRDDKTLLNKLIEFGYSVIVVYDGYGDYGKEYEINKLMDKLK